MIYGLYKSVRNSAWQCLIDFKIFTLPVNLQNIAEKTNIKIIKNSQVNELADDESGMSLLIDNQWYIIYNDNVNIGRRRFTVAHELGHIFLGHVLQGNRHRRSFNLDRAESESEADMFAIRLLAPACVLWGLDLHAPVEIQTVCNISKSASEFRAKRMKILYERNKFLTSPLEQKVFNQFARFILENKKA